MLEFNCLKNLYEMINEFYKKIKIEYQKELRANKFDKLEIFHESNKQLLLDYKTSIYRNIYNKRIPFLELFNINNNNPYNLNKLEAELLRNYIGLYNEGKKQPINKLSKKLKITKEEIDNNIKQIMNKFNDELFQSVAIEERNRIMRNNIKILNKEIPEYDISFLNITDNFIEVLRAEDINKIEDILNINEEQIIKMNTEYGYNSKIVIFPKRVIEEIHSLGLKFKEELMIHKLFDKIPYEEPINPKGKLGYNIKTMADLICARQFEPELINRLNAKEQISIDARIGNGCYADEYNDMQEEALDPSNELIFFEKSDSNYTNGKTYYMDKN